MTESIDDATIKERARLRMPTRFQTPSSHNPTLTVKRLNVIESVLIDKGILDPETADTIHAKQGKDTFNELVSGQRAEASKEAQFNEKIVAESWRIFQTNFRPFVDADKLRWNDKLKDDASHVSPPIIDWVKAEMPALPDADAVNAPDKFLNNLTEKYNGKKFAYKFEREPPKEHHDDKVIAFMTDNKKSKNEIATFEISITLQRV